MCVCRHGQGNFVGLITGKNIGGNQFVTIACDIKKLKMLQQKMYYTRVVAVTCNNGNCSTLYDWQL